VRRLRETTATEQMGVWESQEPVESCATPSTKGSRISIKHVWHFVSKLRRNTTGTNTASFSKNKGSHTADNSRPFQTGIHEVVNGKASKSIAHIDGSKGKLLFFHSSFMLPCCILQAQVCLPCICLLLKALRSDATVCSFPTSQMHRCPFFYR